MDEEQQRREFVMDEANIERAVDGAVELMRLVLRAIAAKQPTRTLERLAAELREYVRFWRDDVPLERILSAAVARMRDVGQEVETYGAVVDAAFPALGYLAEINSDYETHHLRVGKARGEFMANIDGIGARNEARRIMRDLRAQQVVEPGSATRTSEDRRSRPDDH